MLLALVPERVTEMISWTLNYFKKNILGWVLKMGGWVSTVHYIHVFKAAVLTTMRNELLLSCVKWVA